MKIRKRLHVKCDWKRLRIRSCQLTIFCEPQNWLRLNSKRKKLASSFRLSIDFILNNWLVIKWPYLSVLFPSLLTWASLYELSFQYQLLTRFWEKIHTIPNRIVDFREKKGVSDSHQGFYSGYLYRYHGNRHVSNVVFQDRTFLRVLLDFMGELDLIRHVRCDTTLKFLMNV